MNNNQIARTIEINGIVQGVGFRPFIYQLACNHHLTGETANTAFGVIIHVQGRAEDIAAFIGNIRKKAPPLAEIHKIVQYPGSLKDYAAFSITPSLQGQPASTLVSPDVAVCPDCIRELIDPHDRRYAYPFINCTHCGPRYTIIDNIPYDRHNTTMKSFSMCARCRMEYENPTDRRFHAQPVACPQCGPQVTLHAADGNAVDTPAPIQKTVDLLREGCILAIKGLGGFHLAVDAANDSAVALLRTRKAREEKPFALMAFDIDAALAFSRIQPKEAALLLSPQSPIVLLRKKQPNRISRLVAPQNNFFGVMLPYTPLHYLILKTGFDALVMTSGNISDEPIITDNADAIRKLAGIADYFLMHNREIKWGCDDSIVRIAGKRSYPIRRSRGYVPSPIRLKKKVPPILACGAEMKSTICLAEGKNAFLSQHLGDLQNLPANNVYRATIQQMQHLLHIRPEIIACDMHPDYLSTRYAEEQRGAKIVFVQHHHAHIASVMAENKIEHPVIGLAFDGTGWGPDQTIWGGEVLIVDMDGYSRAAHFKALPMPGAGAAVREPWRMAVSYLFDAYGEDLFDLELPLLSSIDAEHLRMAVRMIRQGINAPLTSSMGRLFDGISALCGIRYSSSFEGQAAMALEMSATGNSRAGYAVDPGNADSPSVIEIRPVIRRITEDLMKGVPAGLVSRKFHNTLIHLFSRICQNLRKTTGINDIALSGGVFQNMTLLNGMTRNLKETGFVVHAHHRVPPNDGGISLGQAWVAAASQRP